MIPETKRHVCSCISWNTQSPHAATNPFATRFASSIFQLTPKNKHILRKNHWFHGLPRCVYQKYQHLQTIHWKWVADYFLPGSWSRCETPNLDGLNLRLNRNFMGIHGPFHTHTMTYHHIPIIYFCWLYCMVPIGIPLHNKKTGKSHEIQKKRPHKKKHDKIPSKSHLKPNKISSKSYVNPSKMPWKS